MFLSVLFAALFVGVLRQEYVDGDSSIHFFYCLKPMYIIKTRRISAKIVGTPTQTKINLNKLNTSARMMIC